VIFLDTAKKLLSDQIDGIFMAKVIDDRIYISFRLKAQKIILAGA
jgi:hypothetical protein